MADETENPKNEPETQRREEHGTSNGGTVNEESKKEQLDEVREEPEGEYLTTDQGVRVENTDDSLKAGTRGPTLMEDFHFREKMTHFDHERIPERVVHARGTGVHGFFEPYENPDLGPYESIEDLTKASFLQDPTRRTPMFVRFSTVVGFRGSPDTVRDVRGFAMKFYTEDGNFDLVGNNIPIFFIQDAIKFPDLVHAIKPEPDDEMPQASAAHDTFWDFASLTPETTHMLMWLLSGRGIPRAFRMMEGFGVHTFRFVNDEGKSRFVKFHIKPKLGIHQLVWDETQKIAGKNPDFNREDLYDVIENGQYPEFELGVQIVEEDETDRFDFDLLDPTKIIPEEDVPVRKLGRIVLNRTPDNFFAEVEQAAFHPGNVVPGIDFTNDPLLQGRLFSYQDTQLNRFNGANWDEVPINRPLSPRHNNQRDGFMRQQINKGQVSYLPNSLETGRPREAPEEDGGYVHHAEKISGQKIRERSERFKDHFSQARLFWNSMSPPEQQNMIDAARFELGKVDTHEVKERVVNDLFNNVDHEFAKQVALGIGVEPPQQRGPKHPDHDDASPALSMKNNSPDTIETRKIAVLVDDGIHYDPLEPIQAMLEEKGARIVYISKTQGAKQSIDGAKIEPDKNHVTTASVLFDAVLVPGGEDLVNRLTKQGDAKHFIAEAYKHKKPIAAMGAGVDLIEAVLPSETEISQEPDGAVVTHQGIVTHRAKDHTDAFTEAFTTAIAQHRHWERDEEPIPA